MPGSRTTLQSKCIPMRKKNDAATNVGSTNVSKLEKADSQGQRLSSYATLSTSSSTLQKINHKHNSRQPKESTQYLNSQQSETAALGSPRKLYPNDERRSASQEVNTSSEFQTPVAPTLPMHSPHSPLHPHVAQMHQQNKLSARYINNKTNLNVCATAATTTFHSQNRADVPTSPKRLSGSLNDSAGGNVNFLRGTDITDKMLTNYGVEKIIEPSAANLSSSSLPPLASKLICSCEREECPISPTQLSAPTFMNINENVSPLCDKKRLASTSKIGASKRLVATRNAATSPHLDLRKLINMATVSAKVGLAGCKTDDINGVAKLALEKSNSLGDSKPQKQLRNTRSLSPRPPVRHQQAIIVSDENEVVSVELTNASETKCEPDTDGNFTKNPSSEAADIRKHMRRRRSKNNCRSEQTSPNITDLCDKKFAYNQFTNKSTGCLVYVPTDPWLKMNDQENLRLTTALRKPKAPPRAAKYAAFDMRPQLSNSVDVESDPWVKRTNEFVMPRSPKQERFRQVKSFSATKFDVAGFDAKGGILRPKLQRCKSPAFNDDNLLSRSDFPLQSAPSSPHFLQTPENPFSSAFSLASPCFSSGAQQPFSPPHSASFSPARAKNTHNPFVEDSSPKQMLNAPPPSIAIAAALASKQQQQQQHHHINRSYLDVSNPHLLQARHSFSSVSSKQREDELQLNIRRLSEQMRKATHSSLVGAVKESLSDRNINEDNTNNLNCPGCVSVAQKPFSGADFSDYLEQFRCSEAKKAAAASSASNDTTNYVTPAHSSSKTTLTAHKSQVQADSLLETTC